MNPSTFTIPAEKVARAFCLILSDWLSADQIREVIKRNATPQYEGCCASHDFCDPNQAMLDAFTLCGHDCTDEGNADLQDDEFLSVWSEAWSIAARAEFDAALIECEGEELPAINAQGSIKTVWQIRAKALELFNEGYRLDKKTRRPLHKEKRPMTPQAIQEASGFARVPALQVLHCLNVWSLKTVAVGTYDRI